MAIDIKRKYKIVFRNKEGNSYNSIVYASGFVQAFFAGYQRFAYSWSNKLTRYRVTSIEDDNGVKKIIRIKPYSKNSIYPESARVITTIDDDKRI